MTLERRTFLRTALALLVATGAGDSLAASPPPLMLADVYRQGVAEEILRQREEALTRIRHAGGLALDVPAGRLSLDLVNKYLEVKERGLL